MTPERDAVVECIAVLGGGFGGAGIAGVLALAGYRVRFRCEDTGARGAQAEIDGGRFGLLAATDAGRISSGERTATLERLEFPDELDAAVAGAELVVCTVPDELDAAAALLARVEEHGAAEEAGPVVLAANSGGSAVTGLAENLRWPERLVGWRWGLPTPVSKLAEIVRSPVTAPEVVSSVVAVARRAGKNPVVIADAPGAWGYVTNRLRAALAAEADRIVGEGVATREQVDRLAVDCFGWPSGPFGHPA